LKWKDYEVDIDNTCTNFSPWYIKLNPKAYVPTMLVGNNTPICESADIITYMEKNFIGNRKFQAPCEQDAKMM